MVASCKDLRDAVALCLQRSECVLVQRHTPKECFTDPELSRTLPQPCYVHILRYMDCRRGQADRSKRFIGNGPLSDGRYEEDLQLMRRGKFDAATEIRRLDAGELHVATTPDQPKPREKPWYKFW